MDPSREERRQEQERMRMVYEQLGRELKDEDWEQRRRKWNEEEKERENKDLWERIREKEEEEKRKKEAADQSYEKLQVEVKKYDDGMVLGWKEDIDTLLVFAGLFSAVVTAFLIESYQWLSEDTSVILLTQISKQLNGTQTQPTTFTPDASSIRINCFWFLSLIFSLTSALFGLLCKQWLREHQRDVPTRTVAENLALRQLRRDSFEKWGVASFLSALPILLEIALVFFFIGILDLLWTLHPILFGVCLAAISLSIGLYFLTTILPTITIPRDQARFISTWDPELRHDRYDFGQLAYQFICPYKSPQAWAVYKLFTTLPKPLLRFPFINNFTETHLRSLWDHIQVQTSSWSMFDLRVVRQFDQKVSVPFHSFQLQVYELRALQWAVTMFCDSPSMIPDLENVLETLPHSVALSAVLDRWDIAMWEVKEMDIGQYLRHPIQFPLLPKPITCDPPLHSREGIELLFWHRFWNFCTERYSACPTSFQDELLRKFRRNIPSGVVTLSKTHQFPIPLSFTIALWSHKEPLLQKLGLRLLRHFEEAWKPSPGYDKERHNEERVAFANGLAAHIYYSNPPSVLLTSKRGQDFIRFIHQEIITRQLYSHRLFKGRQWSIGWPSAIRKVQEVGKLPDNYFAPLPWFNGDLPPSSQLPQLEPIRYSVDTIGFHSDNPWNWNNPESWPARSPSWHNDPAGDDHQNIVMDTLRTLWNNARSLVGFRNRDRADEHTGDNALAGGTNQDDLRGLQILRHPGEGSSLPHMAYDNVQEDHATSGSMAGLSDVPHQASTSSLRDQGNDSRTGGDGGNGASTSRAVDVQESGGIQVHESWCNATSEVASGTLNQGIPKSQAVNESPALQSDNDEPAASRAILVVAGGTSSDRPEDSADDSPAPLSTTGGDKPDILVPPGTGPDHPQAVQAGKPSTTGNIASPSERQGEQARHDHEEQATGGIRGTADPSSSQDQGQRRLRRDKGRGSNTINNPNHLRMSRYE
ncbi:hypothetical protein VNI00_016440 [Paramarasmius palmivorus]|uniref:DUF6535 domain-containing protein n=1 Tax=Paramarasmius palmivorus TaxID=297713 RepID=A0AAW0BGP6_9AGAR